MNKEFLESKSRLDEAGNIIENSGKAVVEQEAEGESWFRAFGRIIFGIESWLYDPRTEAELGRTRYVDLLDRLRVLRENFDELTKKYRGEKPPVEKKNELLAELQKIGELIRLG